MELMNRMVGCIGIAAPASVSLTRRGTFCVSDAKAVAKLRVAGRMPITRAWPRSTRTWRSLPSATNAPARPVRRVAGAGVLRRSDRSAETHGPEGMGGATGESSTRYGAWDEVGELRVGPAGERRTKSCGPCRGRRTPGYARTGPPGRQGATTSARRTRFGSHRRRVTASKSSTTPPPRPGRPLPLSAACCRSPGSLKYEAVYLHELADGFATERVIAAWMTFYSHITSALDSWGTYAGRSLRRGACGVSIRTVRPASIAAGVVLREEAVAPPVFRRSGHRMTAITEPLRRAVEVPGLWTPGRRRAESEGRRGGRPQALGSLAGDRCRPCLRWGRETPTLPQRIVILAMINPDRSPRAVQTTETTSDPTRARPP